MGKFLIQALARKTTYEFGTGKVKDEDILKILEAGRWAPSISNIQPWYFIVVRKEKAIKELMKTAFFGAFHTPPRPNHSSCS